VIEVEIRRLPLIGGHAQDLRLLPVHLSCADNFELVLRPRDVPQKQERIELNGLAELSERLRRQIAHPTANFDPSLNAVIDIDYLAACKFYNLSQLIGKLDPNFALDFGLLAFTKEAATHFHVRIADLRDLLKASLGGKRSLEERLGLGSDLRFPL
jgi:hypothetical protein